MWITKFFCEEKTYFRGKKQSLPHFIHNLWISTYVLVCRKKAPESLNFKIKKDTIKAKYTYFINRWDNDVKEN